MSLIHRLQGRAAREEVVLVPAAKLPRTFWDDGFVWEALSDAGVFARGKYSGVDPVPVRFVPLPVLEAAVRRAWGAEHIRDTVSGYEGDDRGWQHVENMRQNLVLWLPRPSERKDPRQIMRVLLSAGYGLGFDWSRFDPERYALFAAAATAVPGTRERYPAPRLPPVVLNDGEFLDGRHRILAAGRAGLAGLPTIDLQDLLPGSRGRRAATAGPCPDGTGLRSTARPCRGR